MLFIEVLDFSKLFMLHFYFIVSFRKIIPIFCLILTLFSKICRVILVSVDPILSIRRHGDKRVITIELSTTD